MMKKLTAVLLLTAMTAGLAACGSNKGVDTNTDAPAQNESTEETVTTEASDAAQNADIQAVQWRPVLQNYRKRSQSRCSITQSAWQKY